MSIHEIRIMQLGGKASPRLRARFVAAYYLLTVLTCAFIFSFHGRLAFTADVSVTVFYLAMTGIFYGLSKPRKKEQGD